MGHTLHLKTAECPQSTFKHCLRPSTQRHNSIVGMLNNHKVWTMTGRTCMSLGNGNQSGPKSHCVKYGSSCPKPCSLFEFCFHFLSILQNIFDHMLLISDSLASQTKHRTWFHEHPLERIQHRFPAGLPLLVLQTSASHK